MVIDRIYAYRQLYALTRVLVERKKQQTVTPLN